MEVKRKICIFCDNPNSFKNREHVFPRWILRALEITNEVSSFSEVVKEVVQGKGLTFRTDPKRTMNYDNYVSRFVCDDCNGGWMSQLESDIKPILLPLIHGSGSLADLSEDDKNLISRWAIKTTCVIDSVGPVEKPTWIAADASLIRTTTTLPKGWVVFAKMYTPSHEAKYDRSTYWSVEGHLPEEISNQLGRFPKTVIIIGGLILLTVFIGDDRVKLRAVPSIHQPLSANLPIEWVVSPKSPGSRYSEDQPPDGSENTSYFLSDALSLLIV